MSKVFDIPLYQNQNLSKVLAPIEAYIQSKPDSYSIDDVKAYFSGKDLKDFRSRDKLAMYSHLGILSEETLFENHKCDLEDGELYERYIVAHCLGREESDAFVSTIQTGKAFLDSIIIYVYWFPRTTNDV